MFRGRLGAGEGLWIEPCNGIHTIGMFFAIDLVMLDKRGDVIGIIKNIPPFRIIRSRRGWRGAIEMRPGDINAENIQIGDRLRLAE